MQKTIDMSDLARPEDTHTKPDTSCGRPCNMPLLICAILCSAGMALNLVWCTLMGHTIGFMSLAELLPREGLINNPRIFFLAGIIVCALASVLIPRQLRHFDNVLRYIFPLIGAIGTLSYALPWSNLSVYPVYVASTGLFLTGIVYFWIVARFVLLLTRVAGVKTVIICVAAGLIIKLPILTLTSSLQGFPQIASAVATPVLAAILFECACVILRRQNTRSAQSGIDGNVHLRTIYGIPQRMTSASSAVAMPSSQSQTFTMCLIVLITSMVFAVVRSISHLGVWGNTYATLSTAHPVLLGLVVPALCVAAFAWLALLKMQQFPLAIRYLPALLVVLVTLLVAAADSNPQSAEITFLSDIIQLGELVAHLLFWTVVATALDTLSYPSYRTVGFAGGVYAAASLLWVIFLSDAPMIITILFMIATYVLVIILLFWVWLSIGKHIVAIDVPATPAETEDPVQSMIDRCTELAETYSLSPRETEVFILLVQGRSHAVIQEELNLSAGTVKTHISHIYEKMGITGGRQELMNLIWN